MTISKVLLLLEHKGLEITEKVIRDHYRDIGLGEVVSAGSDVEYNRKICGELLHSQKPPKGSSSATIITQGAQKYATTYYRIFYIRFQRHLALVIVKPGMEASALYLEAMLQIGKPLMVLDPCCKTYWNECPVITSPHPFMPIRNALVPAIDDIISTGQLNGGAMRSFCLEVEDIIVTGVDYEDGCLHDFCDSRYGLDCPGSCTGHELIVPEVKFRVPGIEAEWVPYTSTILALSVFEPETLLISSRSDIDYIEMSRFLEKALMDHRQFRITGWSEPEVREGDIITDRFKLHASKLEILGASLPRYLQPINRGS